MIRVLRWGALGALAISLTLAPAGTVWADDDESGDIEEGYVQETVDDLVDAQVLGRVHEVGTYAGQPAVTVTDQDSGLGVVVVGRNPEVAGMISGRRICPGSVIEARGPRPAPQVLEADGITILQNRC